MRTFSSADALKRHPEIIVRPVSVSDMVDRFGSRPAGSVKALLIRMGPFDPATDGFPSTNTFRLTAANAVELIRMFRDEVVEAVAPGVVKRFTDKLSDLSFDLLPGIPGGSVGLPDFVLSQVGLRVGTELTARIVDLGIDPFGEAGRCGGMAFAGYDFYLQGWSVIGFGSTPPDEGVLGDYIFGRLIDSLELNARTFVEWLVELYIVPHLDEVANAVLGAAVGTIGGPLGAALGALLGSQVDFFDFGGPGSLLAWTKTEWTSIKRRLDDEAACPIGLIYGDTKNPFDQHQVLAIGYTDDGLGRATLRMWNNNQLRVPDTVNIDFRGDRLEVTGFNDPNSHTIRGIFAERYSPRRPPLSLRA
jgi:hypothetical protein